MPLDLVSLRAEEQENESHLDHRCNNQIESIRKGTNFVLGLELRAFLSVSV